jgi:predicted ATPase
LSRDYARAAPYLRKAGENAMRKHAPREAVEYLRKGLRLLLMLPDSRARAREELLLQMALGPALMATQGYAAREVEQAYRRAQELCQLTGDAARLFPILWGLWLLYLARAELPAARTLGEQLLALAHTTGDPALLLQGRNALGTTLYHLGEFSAAREQMEQAATAYRTDAHHLLAELYGGEDPGVVCLCFLALSLWMLGYPDQAAVRMHEALTLARQLRHPFSLADALGFAAVFHQYVGQTSEALGRATELSATADTHGFPYWSAAGMIVQGWTLAVRGQGEEGGSFLIQQGLAKHRAAGTELFRHYWLALLADAHYKQGRAEKGLPALAEAFAASARSHERAYAAELYRLQGELLLAAASRR